MDDLRAAAEIWARATSRRDGEHAPVDEAALRERLALDGAELILAARDGEAVGFTLLAPHERTVEIYYLAVDPDAWGSGVADELLASAERHALGIGRTALELWAIRDNHRAIRCYERSGWTATDELKSDHPRGRVERRFVKEIVSPTAG
ncbi:GNAT family N-acetyltransferase [Actinokineospora pegani]|uniref:GNAT family N-acetyltransferase n=1 Tax=Actinokineospora pegani TaxID=2654637 RepID=UPI0018D4C71D|nr:GNAT family N-acetyltransferase [Actinokineospora pegani]